MKIRSQPNPSLSVINPSSEWFTPWRFAAILALLIVLSFPSVLFGFEAFCYGDSGLFAYPVAYYHRECFWRGEIPLWNPLNSCGIPFLAQWNTLTLYPLSLFYLLIPMPWSFEVFCLGHIFLAGTGMYSLARRWTNNGLAAAAAGMAFGFNGLTWQATMWPHILAALAWMPWVVMAMERAWRQGGRYPVPAALVGAMQMLSGGAEVIILTWILLGTMCVAQLFNSDVPRGKLIVRAVCVVLLIAGLSCIQLAPFLDLLAHSQRTTNYGTGSMAGNEAMPVTGFINYFVPLFHCVRNAQGVFVQIGQGWVESYFVGIGIIVLALFAVWRVPNRQVRLLGALALFGLLMAVGERGPMYDAVERLVPVIGFMRFPVKFVALSNFAIPLLAAYGLSSLRAAPSNSRDPEWTRAKTLAFGVIGLIAVVLWFAWRFPVPGEDIVMISRNVATRLVLLGLIFGNLALLRWKTDFKLQALFQTGLIVLLWVDAFTQAPNLNPTVPRAALNPNAIRDFFNWKGELRPGVSRALESRDSLWKLVSSGSSDPAKDAFMHRMSLAMNFNLLDEVPKFDGFYSLDIKEHLQIFARVFFTTNEASKLKDFVGISYTSNPTNNFDWVSRGSFLPLVTAGQLPRFVNDAEALRAIFTDGFDPLHTVYLPLDAAGKIHAAGPANAKIVSMQFSPQRLQIEAEADNPAVVVIAQTFYHPWHAYVDGRRTRLWRANYAFQAVEVPPGRHEVKLVYEDTIFLLGAAVSLLSAVVCIALWVWRRKYPVNAPLAARIS